MSRHHPGIGKTPAFDFHGAQAHGSSPRDCLLVLGRIPAKDPTNLAWREMAIDLTFLASIANTPLARPTLEHEQHCNQSNNVNQIKGTYL